MVNLSNNYAEEYAPWIYEEVFQHIKEMPDAATISESVSPYSSNVVLSGNEITARNSALTPGCKGQKGRIHAFVPDLRAGYRQVEMEEEHSDTHSLLDRSTRLL
ncbi:hypothetical protein CHS0354_038271 [Potamilus streckersoni]|uniref:Uncharacterized protein n=1 Tax=Potamilus streckersoni TaxID=2493646 RepID=A0AAE0WB96_9BIVA|nr:hypothetical protein CHS0354_038271 [Potamilus streckersoni]